MQETREHLIYIPPKPTACVLVVLHGAAMTPDDMLKEFRSLADVHGVMLILPHSPPTWSCILDPRSLDRDIALVNQLVDFVKTGYRVDQIDIAGFSDGATCALSIGLNQSHPFKHILSMSIGGMICRSLNKFQSKSVTLHHGWSDTALPISCTFKVTASLQAGGMTPTVRLFEGGHSINSDFVRDFFRVTYK